MKPETWDKCVIALRGYFPAFKMDRFAQDLWFRKLEHLSDQAVMDAVKQLPEHTEWPSINGILKLAEQEDGGNAAEAWRIATFKAREIYQTRPTWVIWHDDPIEHELIAAAMSEIGGSWAVANASNDYQLRQLGKKFCDAYDQARARRKKQQAALESASRLQIEGRN